MLKQVVFLGTAVIKKYLKESWINQEIKIRSSKKLLERECFLKPIIESLEPMGENLLRRIKPEIMLGLGAISTCLLYFGKGFGFDFRKLDYGTFTERLWYTLGAVAANTFFGVMYGFLVTAKRLKDPLIRNYLTYLSMPYTDFPRLLEADQKDDVRAKIDLFESQKRIFKHEGLLDLKIGGLYLKLGELERGIGKFRDAFKDISNDDFDGFIEVEKEIYSFVSRRISSKKIERNPKDLENYFNYISVSLLTGKINEAVNCFEKLTDLDLDSRVELNLLFSLFLDSLEEHKDRFKDKGEIKSGSEQWKKTVGLVLDSEELEFKSLGVDSRNKVLEIGPSEFLRSTFVFKTGEDEEELRRGFEVNSGIYSLGEKVLGKGVLKLARSLSFVQYNEGAYYDVSQRKPLKNLEEAFDETKTGFEKTRIIIDALKNQRKIHKVSKEGIKKGCFEAGKVRVHLNQYDYIGNLHRRLLNRLGKSQKGEELCSAIAEEMSKFSGKFDTVINGDLAISNLLEDGTVIDFEKAAIGNPLIDVATTLEDPKNEKMARENLFRDHYLEGVDGVEREFLEESYSPHKLFVSVCQTGSKFAQAQKKRQEGRLHMAEKDIERSKEFILRAIEVAKPKIKDKFVDYLRSSENAKELIDIL